MSSVASILLGYVLVLSLVIVLARRSTAHWEEARRAARAPHREMPAPTAADPGRPGLVRRVRTTARAAVLRLTPLRAVAHDSMAGLRRATSRLRAAPPPWRALPAHLHRTRRPRRTGSGRPDRPAVPGPTGVLGRRGAPRRTGLLSRARARVRRHHPAEP